MCAFFGLLQLSSTLREHLFALCRSLKVNTETERFTRAGRGAVSTFRPSLQVETRLSRLAANIGSKSRAEMIADLYAKKQPETTAAVNWHRADGQAWADAAGTNVNVDV